jgi:hypothetical protein
MGWKCFDGERAFVEILLKLFYVSVMMLRIGLSCLSKIKAIY